MTGTDAAELALQALFDCRRDANWIVDAALTEAMSHVLVDGWEESLHLVNKAIYERATTEHRGMLTAGILDGYVNEVLKEAGR